MILTATPPLYELREARVRSPRGRVLASVDLTVRDRVVTALVGPAGSGKSTLLRLLSGRIPTLGWELGGQWRFRGETLGASRLAPLGQVAWVPQIRQDPVEALDPRALATSRARLANAFFCGADVILLDEPTRGLPRSDREMLARWLRDHTEVGAAIVVSHDLDFTRRVADEVCLLCDGYLVAHGPAGEFFERPEEELVQQFSRHGSAPPRPPRVPAHFYWLEPRRLAGMGCPGLMRDLDEELFAIAHAGVTLLVSLTEDPLPTPRLRPFGIDGRHLPVRDEGIPSMEDTLALCIELQRAMDRGEVVAVHGHAGLGRTGTVLACFRVFQGLSATEAIAAVRRCAPGSIRTERQAAFVDEFESRR